jgi:carboxylesterase
VALGDPFDFDGADVRGAPGTDGADVGVVCVHGFTGTPYEMRYLGAALARAGFAARGRLLPGHGTSLAELDRTRWQAWVAAVEREIDAMLDRGKRVAVVGQSLGGLLALHAAATAARRGELVCVASLAAPLWLDGAGGMLARWLTGPRGDRVRALVPRVPKLGGSDVRDRHARAENPSYRAVPTRALGELLAFMRVVDDELTAITTPVLVLHAEHDHTAPVACAARIAERTRAEAVRILPHSYHLIAIDVERELVAADVARFIRRHAAPPPAAS